MWLGLDFRCSFNCSTPRIFRNPLNHVNISLAYSPSLSLPIPSNHSFLSLFLYLSLPLLLSSPLLLFSLCSPLLQVRFMRLRKESKRKGELHCRRPYCTYSRPSPRPRRHLIILLSTFLPVAVICTLSHIDLSPPPLSSRSSACSLLLLSSPPLSTYYSISFRR